MKVSSTSSTSASAGSSGAKPAAEGFSRLLAGADGVAPRAAASGFLARLAYPEFPHLMAFRA
jgi:hypothetical protein